MKQEGLKERMELLEIGEKLGWPRLGYGRSTKIPHDKRIPAGQDGWEKFCRHAHVRRIYPALRVGRVLRDNGVAVFHPLSGAEERARVAQDGSEHRLGKPEDAGSTPAASSPAPDLLSDLDPFASPLDAAVDAIKAVTVDNPRPELADPSVTVVTVSATPRPKKGGHKKPPHPRSKRARRG